MKRMFLLFVLLTTISLGASALKFKIVIVPKAYWDGTGCVPRDRGGCIHIGAEVSLSSFTLSNENGKLTLEADPRVLNDSRYGNLFDSENFYIGEITIDRAVLNKIGYSGSNVFPDRKYSYTTEDDRLVINLL